MTRVVLITGAAGFLGRHLAAAATAAGDVVVGAGRTPAAGPWQRFAAVDLRDEVRTRAVLADERPDVVFHAAGLLRGTAAELLAHNAATVPSLCEALHAARPQARLCVVGSSAEYGAGRSDGDGTPEDWPCAPDRPYGVSKLVATQLALAHGDRLGLGVRVARLSNLLGPGLSAQLVVGSLVAQLAACRRAGLPPQVRIGDLQASRDFLDVEDACRGLLALARHDGPHRVFNLASGTCHTIAEVLGCLRQVVGAAIDVGLAAERLPAAGPAIVRLSVARAAAGLGFAPRVALAESLARMWRAAMAALPAAVRR